MKLSFATFFAIVALSLAVWLFFYLMTPEAPLALPETGVVVLTSTAVVLAAKWIWNQLRKRKRER